VRTQLRASLEIEFEIDRVSENDETKPWPEKTQKRIDFTTVSLNSFVLRSSNAAGNQRFEREGDPKAARSSIIQAKSEKTANRRTVAV